MGVLAHGLFFVEGRIVIVVSRCTPNGKYPQFARRLIESCKRFGFDHDIRTMPAGEDWHDVDIQKPSALLAALLNSRKSVCWMDCDCEIKKWPKLLIDPACDFAAYNWHGDPENIHAKDYKPDRLCVSGGVLFFRYEASAIDLIINWQQQCQEKRPKRDGSDPPLNEAFNLYRPPVRALWLPKSYNRMDSHWPKVDPVIDHTFAKQSHGIDAE